MWNFIPHNVFKRIGGLEFVMGCTNTVSKLAIKLFYQQTLLTWKLSYVHNFSPHKDIIWNNGNIIINKSIYKESWIERVIILLQPSLMKKVSTVMKVS